MYTIWNIVTIMLLCDCIGATQITMSDGTKEPIVVVSDIHLGTEGIDGVVPPNRDHFKNFLRKFPEKLEPKLDLKPKHLVLNGDIDDLWRRNIRTLTRENYDIYNLLAELRKNEVEIHYILGNHDWYARRDRMSRSRDQRENYYDTNYEPECELKTHGTSYKFKHGYEFDRVVWGFARTAERIGGGDPHRLFDRLAEFDGDVYGDRQEQLWNRVRRFLPPRVDLSQFGPMLEQLDAENRKHELGIAPGRAMATVRKDDSIHWLCIGHTHVPGIRSDSSVENGGVANSGAWEGGNDTFLLLEKSPGLWRWNNGDPEQVDP